MKTFGLGRNVAQTLLSVRLHLDSKQAQAGVPVPQNSMT